MADKHVWLPAGVGPFDQQEKPEPAAIHVGYMRIHFNRHGAAPLVWTVAAISDAGAVLWELSVVLWELSVAGISCAATLWSRYVPKSTADDEDGKPSAWFELTGTLTIDGDGVMSCAVIAP